jgi:hypothetical protein
VTINYCECGGYGEDTVWSLWEIFHSQSASEESALLSGEGMPACQEVGLAAEEDSQRSGLQGQSEAEPGRLVEQEHRLLEALPGGASGAGGSQPGFAEGSEQTSSFARCCQDGRVGDCKDGRVKIGQIICWIMASGFFLVGSGDCKDGRDKSNFTPYSRHITVIAKKDVIDGMFFY